MEIVSRPPRTIMRPGRNSTWVEIARAECRETGPPSLNRYLARMIRACFVSPLVFHACSNCSLTRANIPLGEEEIEEKERGGREREREIGYFVARDLEMIRRVSTSTPGTTNVSSTMIFFSYFAWRDERYKKEKKKGFDRRLCALCLRVFLNYCWIWSWIY